ncbi:MAG: hypothetical protein GY851_20940 [bacterium]|nr:hypothetical protein [bacterium]
MNERIPVIRFLVIADTHLGANPMGFQMQRGYPERLPRLLESLDAWMDVNSPVDFVLHAGDMVDACSEESIQAAADAFRLSVPVYACLGNHDLTRPDAEALWLQHAPQFFPGGTVQFTIPSDDAVLHVMPSHWSDDAFHWKDVQAPRFSQDQLDQLADAISRAPSLPHILCTHCNAFGLEPDQTGMDETIHVVSDGFRESVASVAAGHPAIRAVIMGHVHANTLRTLDGCAFASATSFVETPFEFKLVEVDACGLRVSTVALPVDNAAPSHYDPARAFVQGRDRDRNCRIAF